MGKYRGGPKPWEKDDPKGRRLDPGQYPEMNAVLYTADPAEFIKMRIESLSLMAGADEQLAPLFAADRMIGAAQFGSMPPPTPDARERYIRMEAVMIANHASEALLRLFFAHVEHPECPWLGMSASTDFGEYKAKVAAALKSGFDREQIANVFLGGVSRVDACIQLSDAEFEDAIDGLEMLLADCANRVLGDSYVYNAVKHGVSAVAVDDDEAKVAWQPLTGEPVILHEGPVHVYLHKKGHPDAAKDEAHWWLTMDDSNPGRELSVSVLITKALDSLWDVQSPTSACDVETTDRCRRESQELLAAGQQNQPGQSFTVAGRTFTRVDRPHALAGNIWARDPDTGELVLLNHAEEHAFWAWAVIEVLRHTGIRVEELLEHTHHSLVQYRLPSTGELVPLLQIASSKTDAERLLLRSPELADAFSAITCRIRRPNGTVALVNARYSHERIWMPPAPLLFQHPIRTMETTMTSDP